jgi:hypothetical protein
MESSQLAVELVELRIVLLLEGVGILTSAASWQFKRYIYQLGEGKTRYGVKLLRRTSLMLHYSLLQGPTRALLDVHERVSDLRSEEARGSWTGLFERLAGCLCTRTYASCNQR